jgi:hypothetical protein
MADVAFQNRALVYRLQRPNGAVTLVGVTNAPNEYGQFVVIRHEMGLATNIDYCPTVESCDEALLEWIEIYELEGYSFHGCTERLISPSKLYLDETRWAKQVLLEGNTQINMSRSA